MTREENRIFYRIGKLFGIFILAAWITIPVFGSEWFLQFPDCSFLQATGFYCPGCGGTRAAVALLTGQPLQSLRYHPFVLYAAVVYLWFMGTSFLQKHFPEKKVPVLRVERWVYAGIGIILGQWLLKNLVLLMGISWI